MGLVKRFLLLPLFLIFFLFASPAFSAPWPTLAGGERGLYGIGRYGVSEPLWTGGAVKKIIRTGASWAMLTSQGILVSNDLRRWESRNNGLPVKIIKQFEGGEKSFTSQVQEIKDLEVHPENPDIFVCAVKDTAFLSQDGGRTWENLGAPSYRTNGIKAVAVASLPDLTVFLSHSTYGVHYIRPGQPGRRWVELNQGIETLETTGNADEAADISAVLRPGPDGGPPRTEIYISQTFRPRLYRLDWEQKRFTALWSGDSPFGTVDSLDIRDGIIRFVREGAITELLPRPLLAPNPSEAPRDLPLLARNRPDILAHIRRTEAQAGFAISCMITEASAFPGAMGEAALSELWLLGEGQMEQSISAGKQGLYLPVNHAMESSSLKPYLDIIAERNLNMVVIDMKDDNGRLRFTPLNQAITEKGRVFRPVDIDAFLKEMKDRGIYTAARIVVFKDPELAKKEGGRFAVWDSGNNKPWLGYYDTRQKKGTGIPSDSAYAMTILSSSDPQYEILRTYYDEQWVDPYSEEVWEYTAAIARELHQRGFDEIQFDYIRFPTDGENLGQARYRWQERGMDMESAILSFLRHVRRRLDAPISIDIYGANGWYRTGARTGQEVELLAPYVDVICPMYYPSHFEQDFLAQAPAVERPYRIYYMGTQRTRRIARGQITVRPYAQAFFLNVSYDRRYYNPDYVRLEADGVRDAGNGGLTYWNNSGRYDDLPFP